MFLSSWYPSRVLPIIGDFIQRHAEAVATKHKVSAVHIITDPNLKIPFEISSKTIKGVTTYIGYIKKTGNPVYKLFLFSKVLRLILNEIGSFDLIHLNKLYSSGWIAYLLNLFYKKPYLISEHWSGYQSTNNQNIGLFEKYLSKQIVKRAAFVCPVSQHLANAMQEFGLKGNYHPVPNVVMTDLFVSKTKTDSIKLRLLHISSLTDEVKNISGIIKTLGALKRQKTDFICYFIGGTGDEFTAVIQQNNLTDKDIQFINFMEQKDLVSYFHQSDILILFSHYENLPCVILEAFSSGTPVISSNVGGISEFFPPDFGLLITANNHQELENALHKVKGTNWASPKKMHQYAVRHFSPETIAEKFDYLYQQMTY